MLFSFYKKIETTIIFKIKFFIKNKFFNMNLLITLIKLNK